MNIYNGLLEKYDIEKNIKTFEERIVELEEFIKLNKRLPKNNSKEKEEKSLSGYLNGMKNRNILEQINIYNSLIEKYDIEKNIKTFEERMIELEDFFKLNKRLPKYNSKENSEKNLLRFIRKIKKKNILEQMNIYNGLVKKYNIKVKEQYKTFEERMIELEDFLKLNKKLPKNHSKNKKEKSLVGFIGYIKRKNILEQMNIYNGLIEKYDIEEKRRKSKKKTK